MRPKWPFWKHGAPKMRLVEAQCAHWKHCYPETPLGSDPTSRVSQQVLALSGTESAILNRESGDSESCDSNRAIPRLL